MKKNMMLLSKLLQNKSIHLGPDILKKIYTDINQLEIFDSHYVIECPNEHLLGIIVNMDEENGFDKKNGIFKVGMISGDHLLTPLLIYSAIGSITDNRYE
jgi:hypothetical protein